MKLIISTLLLFISLSSLAQEQPNAIVEVNKMNVVYRGVHNPLTLSMPGTVSFEASAPGLKKVDNGNYVMSPGSGLTVDIELRGKLPNGETVSAVKTLRIKDIGKPVGTINGIGHDSSYVVELDNDQLKNGKIGVKIEDFIFDLNFKVKEFKIKFSDKNIIKVIGNLMSKEAKLMIDSLKLNEIGFIFDIKIKIEGNNNFKLKAASPIQVKIVK